MRTALVLASIVFAMAGPSSAAGDDTARGIGVYGSFFSAQVPKSNAPAPQLTRPAPQPPKPAVVCGMTLLPAPPIDPAMKHQTPTNRQFPMLKLGPEICKR